MPQSLVLNLVTLSAISKQHLQGYSLQQLFFNLVDTVDPELGRVLRCDQENRSYSLSALQWENVSQAESPVCEPAGQMGSTSSSSFEQLAWGEEAPLPANVRLLKSKRASRRSPSIKTTQLQYDHGQSIPSGTACWWRISFLDDDLFDHLIFLWNQLQDEPFPLGAGSVTIQNIEDELPAAEWVSSCSYRDIYERASARDRDIHLQFVTPTAFEQAGQLTPLPTAEAVFHPLRRRWNRHSGLAFAPSLISNIVPTHFDIQTKITQRFRRRSSEMITGCTGQISFRVAGDADPLIIKRINTLANFSRYCSVGCNTLLGMGVIRRLSSPVSLRCRLPC